MQKYKKIWIYAKKKVLLHNYLIIMRYYFSILFIFGVMALCSAASEPLDSLVVRDAQGAYISKEAYWYDANGKVVNQQTFTWTNGQIDAGSKKYEYCYDEKGTQVLSAQYNFDTSTQDWKGYTKVENVYNAAHQLIAKVTYEWKVKYWVVKQSIEYTYYPNGKAWMTNTVNFTTTNAGAWAPNTRNTKYKDSKNRDSVEVQYNSYKDNAWVPSYEKDYKYDAAGNKIQYDYWSSWSNGAWTADTREEWTYNSNKKETYYCKTTLSKGKWTNNTKRITEYSGTLETLYEEYTGSGQVWNCKTRRVTTYDAQNRKVLYETYTGSGTNWVNSTKEEWAYWGTGTSYPTLHATYTGSGTTWNCTKKEVTEYNAQNRKILYEVYTGSGTTWVKSTRELWEYLGTTSNLTLHEKYTATNNEWVKNLREVTVYNAQNRKVLYEKYNGSNNEWVGAQRDTTVYWNGSTAKIELEEHYVGLEADGRWKGKANGKTIYAYNDAAGSKQTLKEVYTWSNGNWVGANRTVQQYQGSYTILYEYYNSYSQTAEYTGWHGQQKYTQTYSGSQLTDRIDYTWSETLHDWVISKCTSSDYANSKKVQEIIGVWDGTQCVNQTLDKLTYTGNNLTCEEHYTWNGTSWEGKSNGKKEYEYNSSNKQIGSATYTWIDGAWTGTAKSTTTYMTDGRLDSTVVYVWENNNWVVDQKTKGTYTSNEIKVVSWERVNGVLTYKAMGDTIYDNHGNNTLSGQFVWQDDHWVATAQSKTDAHYETIAGVERLMYSTIMDSVDANGWIGKSKMEYAYDEDGYKIFEQSSIWSNGDWEWSWKHEWVYDEHHYTLKDVMHIWDADYNHWMGASWSEYEYSNMGSTPTTVTMYTWDNWTFIWEGRSKTQKVYDANKKLVSDIVYAWQKDVPESERIPETNGKWIGKTKTDYTIDSKGRTIETDTYTWCNGNWGLATISATEYDDDAAGKVRSEAIGTYDCGVVKDYKKTTYYYHSDN